MLKVKDVTAHLEKLAPSFLALPGDNVGLQLGDPGAGVKKILVALDADEPAVKEAVLMGADLLVTHHPLFFEKPASINEEKPLYALAAGAIRARLNIFSAHTNYDIAAGGVSFALAKALELPLKGAKVLEETYRENYLKLVVFVPLGHEEAMRLALSAAGAGQMGDYSGSTFQVKGEGTFLPGAGANPYIGTPGQLERVEEIRLETILPASSKEEVEKALLKAHPYEEPAFDFYPLALQGKALGLGLFTTLDEPLLIKELVARCAARLPACAPRFKIFGEEKVTKIALCGGSGGSLIEKAAKMGAELYLAGDFRYHDLLLAAGLKLSLLDAGHAPTEMPGVVYLYERLKEFVSKKSPKTEVILHRTAPLAWQT